MDMNTVMLYGPPPGDTEDEELANAIQEAVEVVPPPRKRGEPKPGATSRKLSETAKKVILGTIMEHIRFISDPETAGRMLSGYIFSLLENPPDIWEKDE